jgi:hypothetical protein
VQRQVASLTPRSSTGSGGFFCAQGLGAAPRPPGVPQGSRSPPGACLCAGSRGEAIVEMWPLYTRNLGMPAVPCGTVIRHDHRECLRGPRPFPFRAPSFSGQAATEQASGCTGAVKAGVATRSAAEGLALTAGARAAATLACRLAGLGSRVLARAQPVPSGKPLGGRMGGARCTTVPCPRGDGKRCLAAPHEAGATWRRRGISRHVDRSADCCRDCPPLPMRPTRQRTTARPAHGSLVREGALRQERRGLRGAYGLPTGGKLVRCHSICPTSLLSASICAASAGVPGFPTRGSVTRAPGAHAALILLLREHGVCAGGPGSSRGGLAASSLVAFPR